MGAARQPEGMQVMIVRQSGPWEAHPLTGADLASPCSRQAWPCCWLADTAAVSFASLRLNQSCVDPSGYLPPHDSPAACAQIATSLCNGRLCKHCSRQVGTFQSMLSRLQTCGCMSAAPICSTLPQPSLL